MAGTPTGFDATSFRSGILQAMQIGEPPKAEDKPYFVVPGGGSPVYKRRGIVVDASMVNLDATGRPLDPTVSVTWPERTTVQIPVAVEFSPAEAAEMPVGAFRPTKVTITILDQGPDGTPYWDQVKNATDIVLGGDAYMIAYRLPPLGMGTVTVYQVAAFARQET